MRQSFIFLVWTSRFKEYLRLLAIVSYCVFFSSLTFNDQGKYRHLDMRSKEED